MVMDNYPNPAFVPYGIRNSDIAWNFLRVSMTHTAIAGSAAKQALEQCIVLVLLQTILLRLFCFKIS